MKNGKPEHYWRIHARVSRRLLSDVPPHIQDAIASGFGAAEQEWFTKKVESDATRLFEDPSYYDNDPATFRTPLSEDEEAKVRRKTRELAKQFNRK